MGLNVHTSASIRILGEDSLNMVGVSVGRIWSIGHSFHFTDAIVVYLHTYDFIGLTLSV